MIKQLIRSAIGNALVGWIAGAIIAALMVTVRWRAHKDQNIKEILRRNEGVVLVFWHERLLAMPCLWPSVFPLFALQSPHADGRMMSHAIGCFGVKTVWGSSNRNAISGLRGLKRVLDRGQIAAITPDEAMENWLFKVKLNAPSDLDDLMDEGQYKAMID